MSYEQLSLFTDEELGVTPNLIGLTGYAQSGKDTLAKLLVDNYGYRRVAFADKIREFLYEINPMVACSPTGYLRDLVDLVGWDKAKQEPQVRRLLQDLGVGARKLFGDKFWVAQVLLHISSSEKIVITDVRFINEAESIKKYDGAQVWRVKRSGVFAVNTHVSETEMDGHSVDQIFVNNGSIQDLENLLKSRMKNALPK
jgi:hypothetical protein